MFGGIGRLRGPLDTFWGGGGEGGGGTRMDRQKPADQNKKTSPSQPPLVLSNSISYPVQHDWIFHVKCILLLHSSEKNLGDIWITKRAKCQYCT